jgi:RNA polymerase sigma factor (sigma-70 family)
MSEDFNLKITVRNARLLEAIQEKYDNQSAFAKAVGRSFASINGLVTFKLKPVNEKGWTDLALDVCAGLGVQPDEIWPKHLEELKLKRSTAELKMDMDGVSALIPDTTSAETKLAQLQAISELSKDLSERHRKALIMHYVEGKTLEQMGKELDVSRERAKQIRLMAERKMRRKAEALGYFNFKVMGQEHRRWTTKSLNSKALDLLEGDNNDTH